MANEVLNRLKISRTLPQPYVDNSGEGEKARGGRYGEQAAITIVPNMNNLADEGSLFVANNAQTGVATAAAPVAFSATNPFLIIYNTESSDNSAAKRVYPHLARLVATAAGTAAASVQVAVTLDKGNRYSSGGSVLTPVNVNGGVGTASVAKVYAGNLTASAATGDVRTVVGQLTLKGAIPVAGDTYELQFANVDGGPFIGISTILYSRLAVSPIIVPPGWSALVHLWLPSQSAASSYLPELHWFER